MKDKVFTDFFRNAGFSVFASPSADWLEVQKGVLLSIPYHRLIHPPDEELEELLQRTGAIALRYPTAVENYGWDSNMQFCRTVGYSLENLQRQARQQVKKGETNFAVRELEPETLECRGVQLLQKTCFRQNRQDPKENPRYWKRFCDAAKISPGTVAIGVVGESGVAAILLILETPTAAEFIVQCSDPEMLPKGANNILTFYATRRYLSERNPPLPVCYGLGSLEETPSLDRYKVSMGYELELVKQRIYIRRNFRWLFQPWSLMLLEKVAKVGFSKNYYLRKGIGIMRCYLAQH